MAPHSSILAWRIPWTENPGGYSPWGFKESHTTERLALLLNLPKWSFETEGEEDVRVLSRSVVSDSTTPWTVAWQAPLPVGFFRQEYWNELSFLPPGYVYNL